MTDKENEYKTAKFNLANCPNAPEWARKVWENTVKEYEAKHGIDSDVDSVSSGDSV